MEGTLGRMFSKSQKNGDGAEQEKKWPNKRNAIVIEVKGGEKGG